jgi:UbiD family decarboxylase
LSAPAGVEDSYRLGARFGAPIEVMRDKTADLPTAATAESVAKGRVSRDETAAEGRWANIPAVSPRERPGSRRLFA